MVSTTASSTSGSSPRNTPRQLSHTASPLASDGPISPGSTHALDIRASTRARNSSGKPLLIARYATATTPPPPKPCTARPAMNTAMLGASPASSSPAAKNTMALRYGFAGPLRSAQLPRPTVAIMKPTKKALNDQP